jgi:hypothetical protein
MEVDEISVVDEKDEPFGFYDSDPDDGGDIDELVGRFESAAKDGWTPHRIMKQSN